MSLDDAFRLRRLGLLAEAAAACRTASLARPFDARACHLLGMIALERGRPADALEPMRRSVGLCPSDARYRVNLAAVLGKLSRFEEAIAQLTEALANGGGAMPELHNDLGAMLEACGRPSEAAAAYRNAIRLRPGFAEAHHNLGQVATRLGRLKESAASYQQAVHLRPEYSKAAYRLAGVLGEIGSAEGVVAALRKVVNLHPCIAGPRSALLYTLHYCPEYDAEMLYREHCEWGRLFCDPLQGSVRPHENDRDPERRLRVGYVSPDLREHTVTKFISAAIQHHDRERFEVTCYSDAERPDHVSERIKGWCERWHDTRGMSTPAMERLIRDEHRIDILVDLRGHAADNRLTLFARRPAPLQINMVGYFNTTGLRGAMTHRLSDRHMDLPSTGSGQTLSTDHLNVEQLIRMEPSCWCYSPEPDAPEVSGPPALTNGFITFGSLNKVVKISEPCARLWAKVLDATPDSKLLLSAAGDAAGAVRDRLAGWGIAPDRLILASKTASSREYLARFNEIDLALDTFPFGGITTTCDGLWMGVPCVSLAGSAGVSRAGKSILHAAGLPELATDTPGQFVQVAVELARDLDRLRTMRMSMRERLRASPLMDHVGFARKLDAAYRRAWRDWCGKLVTRSHL